jgi:hypothetical protein
MRLRAMEAVFSQKVGNLPLSLRISDKSRRDVRDIIACRPCLFLTTHQLLLFKSQYVVVMAQVCRFSTPMDPFEFLRMDLLADFYVRKSRLHNEYSYSFDVDVIL